jgi:hypothetical protein
MLARLAALCGPDRVGTLMPRNSHLPDAVELGPFAPRPALAPSRSQNGTAGLQNGASALSAMADRDAIKSSAAATVTQLAVRAMRPPHQVEVLCARGGALEFVRGADFGGRVVSYAGPWRIAAAAFHASHMHASHMNDDGNHPGTPGATRDYYDVALEDGGVYRLLCDLRSGEWYVDGIYD